VMTKIAAVPRQKSTKSMRPTAPALETIVDNIGKVLESIPRKEKAHAR